MSELKDHWEITDQRIQVETNMDIPEAGAIVTFNGITRNFFIVNGIKKRVVQLEYEAYRSMALKEMEKIVSQSKSLFDIRKVVLVHRIGVVPVGESSIIVQTASCHRKNAFEAAEWIMDQVKAMLPIWKKEIYEDGSSWKVNCECRSSLI